VEEETGQWRGKERMAIVMLGRISYTINNDLIAIGTTVNYRLVWGFAFIANAGCWPAVAAEPQHDDQPHHRQDAPLGSSRTNPLCSRPDHCRSLSLAVAHCHCHQTAGRWSASMALIL
jgi:hypothetical protein